MSYRGNLTTSMAADASFACVRRSRKYRGSSATRHPPNRNAIPSDSERVHIPSELAGLYVGRPAKPTGRLVFEALARLRLNPARGHDPPTIPTPPPLQAKLLELLNVDPTRPRWAS
jgi:hypothetical protein